MRKAWQVDQIQVMPGVDAETEAEAVAGRRRATREGVARVVGEGTDAGGLGEDAGARERARAWHECVRRLQEDVGVAVDDHVLVINPKCVGIIGVNRIRNRLSLHSRDSDAPLQRHTFLQRRRRVRRIFKLCLLPNSNQRQTVAYVGTFFPSSLIIINYNLKRED